MSKVFTVFCFYILATDVAFGVSFDEVSLIQKERLKEDRPKDAEIIVFDFKNFPVWLTSQYAEPYGKNYIMTPPGGVQFFSPSTPLEKEVLRQSDVDTRPKEILTLAAFKNGRMIHFGDFGISQSDDHIGKNLIHKMKVQFFDKFRKKYGTVNSKNIDYIAMIHSHPSYDSCLSNNRGYFIHPVSRPDFAQAYFTHISLKIPVIVTAVTAGGYSYHGLIRDKSKYRARELAPLWPIPGAMTPLNDLEW